MSTREFPPNFSIQENILLADFTNIKIGGLTDFLSIVKDQNIFISLYRYCREIGLPFLALGDGTNVFFPESGYRGLVAIIKFDKVSTIRGGAIVVEAGASLDQIRYECIEHGLTGFEFASGIPGSIGGAVYGNAGAHGSDMADSLKMAEILHKVNGKEFWPVEKLAFEYRSSILKRGKMPCVVLSATFTAVRKSREEAWEKIQTFQEHRKKTQPPGASMGSIFKNPPGDYAGRLIEAAGLKGHRVGRAMISPQHANFIINMKGASAQDIWHLIRIAQETVHDKFGIHLEPEIEMLGAYK